MFKSIYLWLFLGTLLTGAALFEYTKSNRSNSRAAVVEVQKNLHREIEYCKDFLRESELESENQANDSEEIFPYPHFVFNGSRLVSWSTNKVTIRQRDIRHLTDLSLLNMNGASYLLIRNDDVSTSSGLPHVCLLPLKNIPPVKNRFLQPTFNDRIFVNENFQLSSGPKEAYEEVLKPDGTPCFYLQTNRNYFTIPLATIIWGYALFVLCISSLIIYLMGLKGKVPVIGYLLVLLFSTVLVRVAMIHTGWPFGYQDRPLFSSMQYASSLANPSLADLFLNFLVYTIWAWQFFLVYTHVLRKIFRYELTLTKKILISVFTTLIGITISYLIYRTILSLNTHSQWAFDVTKNVSADVFLIMSVMIFILCAIILFFTYHILLKLLLHAAKSISRMALVGLSVFIVGLAWLILGVPGLFVSIMFIAHLILVHLLSLHRYMRRIQYRTFMYLFIGCLPAAFISALAIYQYSEQTINDDRQRLAGQLAIENDLYAEFLLNEVKDKIKNDVFIQSRIFSPYGSKDVIALKIKRAYLNNYFDKYDVQIKIFNSQGDAFEGSSNYRSLRKLYTDYPTDFEDLFFMSRYGQNQTKRYLLLVEIERYQRTAGYIVVELRQKKIIPTMVYPLVGIETSGDYVDNPSLQYAIVEQDKIVYKYGDFNYSAGLSTLKAKREELLSTGVYLNKLRHYGYETDDQKLIIISNKENGFWVFYTNFCMLFIIAVFTIALYLVILTLEASIKKLPQNYSTRIQLYLNFAFFSPLVIVSATTISIIVKTNRDLSEEQSLTKAKNVSARISGLMDLYQSGTIERENLSNELVEIGRFGGYDLNLYNEVGRLIATTQRSIYDNGLLSEYIEPGVYSSIVEGNNEYAFHTEEIGELEFDNAYVAVKSFETGKLTAVLSLPFFSSEEDLEQRVINVFVNIIIVFTIIFILFLITSYYVSGWLTLPLRLITQRLKKMTLTERNEPLEWESDDEFGLMIGEYNNMLVKLEDNKRALARSQKESAWREIARQVAHEIKNPLTPMKLTLQHMYRVLTEENNDQKKKQIESLLHQIDTLSDIATSFSAFAKMPVPESEDFDMIKLLQDQIELFATHQEGLIEADMPHTEVIVNADRKWLGRAISNIIINGFQAGRADEKTTVKIKVSLEDRQTMLLIIADNGTGIDEDVREKIFVPNFSTKNSGSGIGLAVAKRAVEHAGGDIWFETIENEGTTFYIKLPVVKHG